MVDNKSKTSIVRHIQEKPITHEDKQCNDRKILFIFILDVFFCICHGDFLLLSASSSKGSLSNFLFFFVFLYQLTETDIMSSLCGVDVRVHVSYFSETTRPGDMLFFLKDSLSI